MTIATITGKTIYLYLIKREELIKSYENGQTSRSRLQKNSTQYISQSKKNVWLSSPSSRKVSLLDGGTVNLKMAFFKGGPLGKINLNHHFS